jgi:hypothetical protein
MPIKRGRKPKLQKDDVPKKRGRKPKTKVGFVKTINEDNESVIIHLALNKEDIEKEGNDNMIIDDVETEDVEEHEDVEEDSIPEKKKRKSPSLLTERSVNKTVKVNHKDGCNKKCKNCKQLKKELKELRKQLNIDEEDTMLRRVTKLDINFIEVTSNKKIEWKTETDVACWWCTETFNTVPVVATEKYIDDGKTNEGTFHVFGCFCSFNCSASYILNMDDHKVWERYAILCRLYYKLFGKEEKIKPAPTFRALDKFGGKISIEKFRKGSLSWKKEYRYVIPPMVPIIPYIEEDYDGTGIGVKKTNLRGAKLQRSKPPVKNNSLLKSLGATMS